MDVRRVGGLDAGGQQGGDPLRDRSDTRCAGSASRRSHRDRFAALPGSLAISELLMHAVLKSRPARQGRGLGQGLRQETGRLRRALPERVALEMDPAEEQRVPRADHDLEQRLEIDVLADLAPARAVLEQLAEGRANPPVVAARRLGEGQRHHGADQLPHLRPLRERALGRALEEQHDDAARNPRAACEPPRRSRRDRASSGPPPRAADGASTGND